MAHGILEVKARARTEEEEDRREEDSHHLS